MMQPFFSICIAAYNAGQFIEECLESIAVQDYRDFEVIVVDDGSSDPLFIDEETSSHIPSLLVKRTKNSGPYAARQLAFNLAQGGVILCIDADDCLLDSSALGKMKASFDQGADIVLFNACSSKQNPKRIFDLSELGTGGWVSEGSVWSLFGNDYSLNSLCCKAFRSELYRRADKVRPRLLMAEDRLQSLEIMKRARSFWLIDEPLYYYRPNPGSTTNSVYDPSYFRQVCYVEGEVLEYLRDSGMKLDEWASFFLKYTSNALLGIRYNNKLNMASRCKAYACVRGENILNIAFEHCPACSLHMIDGFRLGLLNGGRYLALDVSMLPWRIGSSLKRLARRVAGMRS